MRRLYWGKDNSFLLLENRRRNCRQNLLPISTHFAGNFSTLREATEMAIPTAMMQGPPSPDNGPRPKIHSSSRHRAQKPCATHGRAEDALFSFPYPADNLLSAAFSINRRLAASAREGGSELRLLALLRTDRSLMRLISFMCYDFCRWACFSAFSAADELPLIGDRARSPSGLRSVLLALFPNVDIQTSEMLICREAGCAAAEGGSWEGCGGTAEGFKFWYFLELEIVFSILCRGLCSPILISGLRFWISSSDAGGVGSCAGFDRPRSRMVSSSHTVDFSKARLLAGSAQWLKFVEQVLVLRFCGLKWIFELFLLCGGLLLLSLTNAPAPSRDAPQTSSSHSWSLPWCSTMINYPFPDRKHVPGPFQQLRATLWPPSEGCKARRWVVWAETSYFRRHHPCFPQCAFHCFVGQVGIVGLLVCTSRLRQSV